MKTPIFILLLTFLSINLFGQDNDTWDRFYNQDSTLIGFKDLKGIVKIEPKFTTSTTAIKFENIMAVIEDKNETLESYYLTKAGRIVGRDSLFYYENKIDCENEEYIRFLDRKKQKMGLFDKYGNIAIPATYSYLSKVINGLVVAKKNATEIRSKSGNVSFWSGGQTTLIDSKNKTIITNFNSNTNLDFYSLQKSKTKTMDASRETFKGVDGDYYSFIDFEKEFKLWLTNDLLINLTTEKLTDASFDHINWESKSSYGKSTKKEYVAKNFTFLKNELLEIQQPNCVYYISSEILKTFSYEGDKREIYFNICDQLKNWQYPILSLYINHTQNDTINQNEFNFLRTEHGYKLISLINRQLKKNDL